MTANHDVALRRGATTFSCNHHCGFEGGYEAVKQHEAACAMGCATSTAVDRTVGLPLPPSPRQSLRAAAEPVAAAA